MNTPSISPLRGLVEVTRLLRTREESSGAPPDAVARTIGESLGYATVAVNLYRPAWTTSMSRRCSATRSAGGPDRERPRGQRMGLLLADRFAAAGRTSCPGARSTGRRRHSYTPQGERPVDPDAWRPRMPCSCRCATRTATCSESFRWTSRSAEAPADERSSRCSSRLPTTPRSLDGGQHARRPVMRHQRCLEQLLAVSSRITGRARRGDSARRVHGHQRRSSFQTSAPPSSIPASGAVIRTPRPAGKLEAARSPARLRRFA